MKYILFVFLSFMQTISSFAQEKFIEHLTAKGGKATVSVSQDQRLTDFVNGDYIEPVAATPKSTVVEVRKVVQRQKARGFRIQVYWGGSQTADKGKAQQAGYRVTSVFPELQAYTTFESPHWRCRVGDFATQQEANQYLSKIKSARIAADPIIVKSEVYTFR